MADCALTMENVPIFPFLQPSRKIDVIIAVDSVSDLRHRIASQLNKDLET
jgi:hypothetical protein